jgi:hypothetical protein
MADSSLLSVKISQESSNKILEINLNVLSNETINNFVAIYSRPQTANFKCILR